METRVRDVEKQLKKDTVMISEVSCDVDIVIGQECVCGGGGGGGGEVCFYPTWAFCPSLPYSNKIRCTVYVL